MGFDNVNVNVSGGQSIIKALQNYNTVILKPNIVDNRNVLTQEMMSERHTKYVIRWNYSLEGATINVPEDCIIEFAGGTIDNGTIVGNNTILMYSKPIDEVCLAERQGTFIYNTTVADEEDITSASGQLKFKDRPATDGMGRKILRKNIVNGVNTLTQSMMSDANTIYIIQYDFTLGEDITIPANCVLEFDGGSLSNGTLILDYTCIQGTKGINCTLAGTIGNSEVNVNILKDELDSTLVNTLFAVKPAKVIFNAAEYPLKNIEICANVKIEGNDSKIIPQKKEQDIFENFNLLYNVFNANNINNVSISGFYFESDIHDSTPDVSQKQSVYSDPLINVVNAKNVTIANCVFKNIEGCTYINPNYTHYGKKQGLLICVWDADKTIIENIETTQCRYDEQIWIIACDKDRKDIDIIFKNNYIHDQNPQINSSAFTCVANNVLFENNKVDNYNYTGSIFNLFGTVVTAINNTIINSRATSVFDTSEYGYFFNNKVTISNNYVDCKNATLLVTVSENIIMDNNNWYGHVFLYSDNHHAANTVGEYNHFYRIPQKSNISTIIKNNIINCTNYSKEYPVAGKGDILHKIYVKPLEYYGDFIIIEGNSIYDIVEYDDDDENTYYNGVKQEFTTININNIKDIIIKSNIFYTAPKIIQSSVWKSNISIRLLPILEEENISELPIIDIIDNTTFTTYSEYSFCDIRSLMKNPIIVNKVTMNNNKLIGLIRLYYGLKTPYLVKAIIREFISTEVVNVVTPLILYIKTDIYNGDRKLIGAYNKEKLNNITLEYSDFTSIQDIIYNNTMVSVSVGQQIRMGNNRVYKVVVSGTINPEDVPQTLPIDDFVTIGNVILYPISVERNPKSSNYIIDNVRPSFSSGQKGVSMYDTTINKPIWWTGSAWVDATGATV